MIRKRTFGRVNDSFNARTILIGLLAIGILAAGIGLGTGAIFTDTQAVPANTFSTGTVDISTSPISALVTFSGMAPGDQVTNPIVVTNSGTLELRYAVVSTTTEDALAAQLDLTIKSGVATCTNGGFGAGGTVIYGPGDLGSIAGINVIGNPTPGNQGADRTLPPNETLCFNVSLPLNTGNAFQGLNTTATFTFYAEQTKNNP